jgi:hypothetical protein
MRTLPYQLAAAAFVLLAGTTAASPAQAESVVEPAHSFDFVVDNGVCDFPVEYSGTTRDLGVDTHHGFITMTPNWTVTITNVVTGKSWSPRGTGSITFNESDDGTFTITADGVNIAPGEELLFKGHWSFTVFADGTDTGWVGTGQLIDVCERLS